MTLVRYAFISRNDDKVSLFAPNAEGVLVDKATFAQIFKDSLATNPDIMPQTITGLGLSFGVMPQAQWEKLINQCKKLGCEIIE